jgi:hypothetical protein
MSSIPKLAGVVLGLLSWVAAWGLIDLFVHNWSNRQKFWFYAVILFGIGIVIHLHPDVLEYF